MILGPEPRSLTSVREFIRATLQGHPELKSLADEMVIATHEACKNAIFHNIGTSGDVEVECSIREDSVVAEVRDRGKGMGEVRLPPIPPGPEDDAGRGLYIIYALMDRVEVRTGETGTSIRMEKSLS